MKNEILFWLITFWNPLEWKRNQKIWIKTRKWENKKEKTGLKRWRWRWEERWERSHLTVNIFFGVHFDYNFSSFSSFLLLLLSLFHSFSSLIFFYSFIFHSHSIHHFFPFLTFFLFYISVFLFFSRNSHSFFLEIYIFF